MTSFKELIQKDNKTVFISPEEFGEPHDLNGKTVYIVIDNNEIIEREKKYKDSNDDGVHAKQLLFYVAREDFGALPSIGRMLMVDGERYAVTDAINESGIYSITLEATRI